MSEYAKPAQLAGPLALADADKIRTAVRMRYQAVLSLSEASGRMEAALELAETDLDLQTVAGLLKNAPEALAQPSRIEAFVMEKREEAKAHA